MTPAWRRYVRPQDFVWLLFFSALAIFSPERHPVMVAALVALGVVQVLEPRLGAIPSVVLKLALCYPLIGYSYGVSSSFYLVLFLPVISAATSFGLLGSTLSSVAASAMYLSFLLFLGPDQEIEDKGELILRVLFLPAVGFLTNQLFRANREEAKKSQAAAEKLAEANRSLEEAEAQMRRADRLAALGQLTAGLAHELRNPLGTLKTSAELLERKVATDNDIAREMAGYITQEVDRMNSLITRFLDFARPRHLRLEKTDLHAMLNRAIERFDREKSGAAASATVFKNYSPDVPPVRIEAELMEHVITNLLSNAAQASPAGAVVTLKTRLAATAEGRMAEIAVIDRGSGIDPKHLENIFNPFFTTKAEGVGLGLAIVSKIVDEHGGQIAVESAWGEGSVFRVYLPVAE
ncbi:MAG: signal transduction histidine kinase, nitrogen specific, NtrB [Bryobacterales bacterium]|nr:signal transduction histidine kinase, nitrogen specific, NtrB [Bryobacterales bacterium]